MEKMTKTRELPWRIIDLEKDLDEMRTIHRSMLKRNKLVEAALELAVLRLCCQVYGFDLIEKLLPESKMKIISKSLDAVINAVSDNYSDLGYLNGLAKMANLHKKEMDEQSVDKEVKK